MGIAVGVVRHPIMARSSLRRTSMDGGDRGLKRTLSRMVPVECRSRPWRRQVVDRWAHPYVVWCSEIYRYEKLFNVRILSSGISSSSALYYAVKIMSGSGKSLLGVWLYKRGQNWAVKEGSPLHKPHDVRYYVFEENLNRTKRNFVNYLSTSGSVISIKVTCIHTKLQTNMAL